MLITHNTQNRLYILHFSLYIRQQNTYVCIATKGIFRYFPFSFFFFKEISSECNSRNKVNNTKSSLHNVLCVYLLHERISSDANNMLFHDNQMVSFSVLAGRNKTMIAAAATNKCWKLREKKMFTCGTTNRYCYRWHHCNRYLRRSNLWRLFI